MTNTQAVQLKNIPATYGLAFLLVPTIGANATLENYSSDTFLGSPNLEFPTSATSGLAMALTLPYSLGTSEIQKRLTEIEMLEENWNGYGAKKIEKRLLDKALSISYDLQRLFGDLFFFPTARASIQIEFQNADKELFELEIFHNKYAITKVSLDGTEIDMESDSESEALQFLSQT
jgi:hypothetical protein